MPSYRPKRTRVDANHNIVIQFFRGHQTQVLTLHRSVTSRVYQTYWYGYLILLYDVSAVGGMMSDWMMFCPEREKFAWLEVKTAQAARSKNSGLTEDEHVLRLYFPKFFYIISDFKDMERMLREVLEL